MKKISLTFFIVLIISAHTGCDQSEDTPIQIEETSYQAALMKFDNIYKTKVEPELKPLFRKRELRGSASPSTSIINNEGEAMQVLQPLVDPSIELLNDYGFTDADYMEIFDTTDLSQVQPAIIQMGMVLYEIEMGSYSGGGSQLDHDPWSSDRIPLCVLETLGVSELYNAYLSRSLSTRGAKRAVLKLLGKTASRLGMGFLGVAVAIGDFAWCMGRA